MEDTISVKLINRSKYTIPIFYIGIKEAYESANENQHQTLLPNERVILNIKTKADLLFVHPCNAQERMEINPERSLEAGKIIVFGSRASYISPEEDWITYAFNDLEEQPE
jgi:hypothetical protein